MVKSRTSRAQHTPSRPSSKRSLKDGMSIYRTVHIFGTCTNPDCLTHSESDWSVDADGHLLCRMGHKLTLERSRTGRKLSLRVPVKDAPNEPTPITSFSHNMGQFINYAIRHTATLDESIIEPGAATTVRP